MSAISDQELQRHLSRRTSKAMPAADREGVLAAVAGARARPRFTLRMRPRVLLAPIAAAVLVVLIGVPLMWTLAPGPEPSRSPSPSPATIYSAQQLSDMIGDPAWVGRYVLAQAQLRPVEDTLAFCGYGPCLAKLVGVSGQDAVNVATRDATSDGGVQLADGTWVKALAIPQQPGVFAFKVASDAVEYLGPASLATDGSALTVEEVSSSAPAGPTDDVFVVSGWLVEAPGMPCPTIGFVCSGAFVTPEQTYTGGPGGGTITLPGSGLHVQSGAYPQFASSPAWGDRGAEPRYGTYLVRSLGCPADVSDCPAFQMAFRMVGRLDDASAGPTPSPTAQASPFTVLTQDQLIGLAQDSSAVGRVVVADAQFTPMPVPTTRGCSPPDLCYVGQIGLSPGIVVNSGWRDATSAGEGTYDFSSGRWFVRLQPSSGDEHAMAFRIGHDSVEYLGTVQNSGDSLVWSPDDVPPASAASPDSIYVVEGWLVRTLPVPCPMPGGLPAKTDFGYFCGGSFITATADAIAKTKNDLDPGGLHVQAGAYDTFALNPASIPADTTLASTSDRAVYLVRPVGERLWEANAWRLVDRLDPPMAAPGPSPSESLPATATPPAVEPVHIYAAQQMVDMVGVPGLVGRYVLARAQMEQWVHYGNPPCVIPDPCWGGWGLVGVSGQSAVSVPWRDTNPGEGTSYQGPNGTEWLALLTPPTDEDVYAFKILANSVEYLGPAQLAPDGSAKSAADLLRLAPNGPTDDVYIVSGPLTRPNSPECPAPNDADSNPDLSWFCGGSWITSSYEWPVDPLDVNGIHVQWTAYKDFAPTPFYDSNGGSPSSGTYLVRSVGCPADVTGDCPVYRMIGRLNPVMVSP